MKGREQLTITRIEQGNEPEHVATLPLKTGVYNTDNGVIDVRAYPMRGDNHMKVILGGPVVPTIKERGKHGQFRRHSEYPRRVVRFPEDPRTAVRQDLGVGAVLLFERAIIKEIL